MAAIPLRYKNDTDPVSGGLIREADLLARQRDQIDDPRAEQDRLLTQTERLTLDLPRRAPPQPIRMVPAQCLTAPWLRCRMPDGAKRFATHRRRRTQKRNSPPEGGGPHVR